MSRTLLLSIVIIGLILISGFLLRKPPEKQPSFVGSIRNIGATSSAVEKNTNDAEKRYINPNYAFSFIRPYGLIISSFNDIDVSGFPITTILLQPQDSSKEDAQKGLQILISSWDEAPETLTALRIHKDIPQMKISDVTTHDIKNIGTVIEFESDNANFGGHSHEVWFVAHNDLYQISTYAKNKKAADDILSTWNFQ